MQYSVLAAVAAFSSAVMAYVDPTADFDSVYAPVSGGTFSAGCSMDISWTITNSTNEAYKGTVTIGLLAGDSQGSLYAVQDIGTVSNTALTYNWAIPSDVVNKNVYGFTISLTSNPSIYQYSNPFKISFPSGSASASCVGTTMTVHVSTGSAYTAESTSTSSSTTSSSTNTSTSWYVPQNSTATATTSSTVAVATNGTLSTTLTPTVSTTTTAASTSSKTTTTAAAATTNAAAGNVVTGSVALFGAFALAFAL